MFCYFLSASSCEQGLLKDERAITRYCVKELEEDSFRHQQFVWLADYFMRQRQETRRRVREFLKKQSLPQLTPKCTVFHVRRADATSEKRNKRNFYPLSRYLEMGDMANHMNETILLLTDDQTTLEEAHLLHPEYKWVYFNRTRYRGAVARNSHLPSGDHATEVLVILAELRMASACQRLVRGTSNMVKFISRSMMLRHGVEGVTDIQIDKDIDWTTEQMVPGHEFVKELDAKLALVSGIICKPWSENLDQFWEDHPDWQIGQQNTTHSCFQKIRNPAQAQFLRELHASQFPPNKDCSRMVSRNLYKVGFSAAISYLTDGFWGAFRTGRPYQHTKEKADFRYMYTPQHFPRKRQQPYWAGCASGDLFCYFLRLSSCDVKIGTPEFLPRRVYTRKELHQNKTLLEQNIWLTSYAMRPKHETKRQLFNFMQSPAVPQIQTPCTVVHVRRADAATEIKHHPRRFYSLNQYLEKGNVTKGENIFLMTDDEMAIDEAHFLHPEYNWMLLNRTRHRGAVKRNKHIPSDDVQLEVLIILAELELAGQCRKVIHGTSHMVQLIRNAMALRHGLSNVEMVQIDQDMEKGMDLNDTEVFVKETEKKISEAKTNAIVGTK